MIISDMRHLPKRRKCLLLGRYIHIFPLDVVGNLLLFSLCVVWGSLNSVFNVDSVVVRLATDNEGFTAGRKQTAEEQQYSIV